MKSMLIKIALATFVLAGFRLDAALAEEKGSESTLQIYLLREKTIEGDTITLKNVGLIRGDEQICAKAAKVKLGKIALPGQIVTVTRTMIMSRLASERFDLSKVLIVGAEKAIVGMQHQKITGGEFLEVADGFLSKNPPANNGCQWESVKMPKDMVISVGGKEVKLNPSLAKTGSRNHIKVRIAAVADGNEIDSCEVLYRLKYKCRQAVTLTEISSGTVLSPQNVAIETKLSTSPEPANWTSPYGLIAKRSLKAGTVLQSTMAGPPKPEVIIQRNQSVVLIVNKPPILLRAQGKALEKGCAGDCIRVSVKVTNTPRTIRAIVKENGTLEPIY